VINKDGEKIFQIVRFVLCISKKAPYLLD